MNTSPQKQAELPFSVTPFYLERDGRQIGFVQPSDKDAVIDSVPEEKYQNDKFLPYWAEHWPSAGPFFSHILGQAIEPDTIACELGCGLGVVSSGLAIRDIQVVAVDIAFESCQFAAYNIAAQHKIPRVVCCDWRNLPFRRPFDLIVASDVLYEERWIPVLIDAVDLLLTHNGKALIADPCRRYWSRFKTAAEGRGFMSRIVHEEQLEVSNIRVEICELTRKR